MANDWIGIRLQGPPEVMRELAARLGREMHANDDRGAISADQVRSGRVYFWVQPDEPQFERLVQLLIDARPDGDAAPMYGRRTSRPRR
jgi:hypothetical protein